MEARKVVRVKAGEFSPSYGIVLRETNGSLVCRLSGDHFTKGPVEISENQTEQVEDLRAGVAFFTIENLVWWIRHKIAEAKANGVVVGVSGGIDSAVVSALCKKAFPERSLGLIMPCNSIQEDRMYAEEVCNAIGLDYKVMDLSDTYNVLIKTARSAGLVDEDSHPLVGGNLKARLRMSTLYLAAQERGYLVVGTDNAPESVTGYFTKYGDGGVDILPISSLLKRQVRELARYLGIPAAVISKPPSAGLYEGQTDESEMGLRYDDIDDYIAGLEVPAGVKQKIQEMEARSQHKREMPPSAPKEMNALFVK
ncbi:NAD(+) synthase [Effusibacillus lacus]|uniref:NH(3)-dependent NAD(+) synthetase n=1 Tax=Effusibacillus lacus TaxID=1348429 RepID=A0A292YRD8_9BACL|nr:NAD(+) synthase [Effusibacillus lacus]TCS68950.1 NAD+ synthase [Effusibacillus lacus]GAX91481.1 NAD(+) synthetase [Effusibacillus lacus]